MDPAMVAVFDVDIEGVAAGRYYLGGEARVKSQANP
jgi:hypothetical protein